MMDDVIKSPFMVRPSCELPVMRGMVIVYKCHADIAITRYP